LPVGSRRRAAGADPLLRARRRDPDPPPDPHPAQAAVGGGRGVILASSINDSIAVVVLAQAVVYGTPLLYAALGELLAERSGVLNLGVEGMMLIGAVMGFWAVQRVGGPSGIGLAAGIGVAAPAGAGVATVHAVLVVTFRANQIVSGLAITIFAGAAGLSDYLGNDLNLADQPARHSFQPVLPDAMQNLPIVGPILFGQTVLVYASWVLVIAIG